MLCNMFLIIIVLMLAQHGDCLATDSPATSSDASMVMLAEEKQLRVQLANQVSDLETKLTDQVTELQNKVNSLESRTRECGCDGTQTGSPAFVAALSADLHCSDGQAVVFDDVKMNHGNAYSNAHGTFTAPVSGTYMFTATLSSDDHSTFHVVLVQNSYSNKIGYMYANSHSLWEQSSTTVLTHMNAGDDVWMACYNDPSMIIKGRGIGGFHSHMAGILVSADTLTSAVGLEG